MNCGIDHDKIHAYLKGRLNPEEAAEFERHLATCGDCRREVAQERKLDSLLSAWEIPEPRPGFSTRLQARLAGGKTASPKWAGLALPAFSALAAVLIVSGMVLWHEWPKLSSRIYPPIRTEIALAGHFEFLEKLDMLQQWEMLQHWDEIAAAEPGPGKM